MEDLIQTDATIHPENSVGPLLDSEGKIIGINTAIISLAEGSAGIDLDSPVDTAKRIIPELVEKGYVSRPWLGAILFPLLPGWPRDYSGWTRGPGRAMGWQQDAQRWQCLAFRGRRCGDRL